MVDKFVNPECSQLFDCRSGRLYCFPIQAEDGRRPANSHGLVHHWLCESCAKTHTFEERVGLGMAITPRSATMPEDKSEPSGRVSGAA